MEISNKKLKELVKLWDGHIINHTRYEECGDPSNKCPLNKFFNKLKKELAVNGSSRKEKK